MDGAAVGGVEDVQAVVDAQQRKAAIVAPQTQLLRFRAGVAAVGVVTGQDDAVNAVEDFVPGTIADVGHEHRLGFGGAEASGDARRPQTATVSLVAVDMVLAVDPDADGGSATRH
jgi:hypothetical protein